MAGPAYARNDMLKLLYGKELHQVVDPKCRGQVLKSLSEEVGRRKPTVYMLIRSMEDLGLAWIRRKGDRVEAVGLTEKGIVAALNVGKEIVRPPAPLRNPAASNSKKPAQKDQDPKPKKRTVGVIPSKPIERIHIDRKSGFRRDSRVILGELPECGFEYSQNGGLEKKYAKRLDTTPELAMILTIQMAREGLIIREAWGRTLYGIALPESAHLLNQKIMSEDQIAA